jgi:hypothetical protein
MFFLCDIVAEFGIKKVKVKGFTRITNGKVSPVRAFLRNNRFTNKVVNKNKGVVLDKLYFGSLRKNVNNTAKRIIDVARYKSGSPLLPENDAIGFAVRKTKPPKKTIKAFKAFRMIDGELYPMFVGAKDPLPQGVWLDATEGGYRFNDVKGRTYVPALTGDSRVIDPKDMDLRKELLKRGLIQTLDQKTVKGVAYRPGWHAGNIPIFPQSGSAVWYKGKKVIDEVPDDYLYPNIHNANTVMVEVELDADYDYKNEYLTTAKRTKKGAVNHKESGLRYVPKGGYYEYATNPLFEKRPELGNWYISGSMKINRVLSQKEVNDYLANIDVPKQRWIDGDVLDLDKHGYNPELTHNRHKLRDTVTYDNAGKIIPPSKRFDKRKKDPRY